MCVDVSRRPQRSCFSCLSFTPFPVALPVAINTHNAAAAQSATHTASLVDTNCRRATAVPIVASPLLESMSKVSRLMDKEATSMKTARSQFRRHTTTIDKVLKTVQEAQQALDVANAKVIVCSQRSTGSLDELKVSRDDRDIKRKAFVTVAQTMGEHVKKALTAFSTILS